MTSSSDRWPACDSLDQVRENIDRLDRVIAPLMCERAHYVNQAAKFKDSEAAVIVPERIQAIVDKVRAMAEAEGANPDLLEAIYRAMIDAYIVDEQARWREINE